MRPNAITTPPYPEDTMSNSMSTHPSGPSVGRPSDGARPTEFIWGAPPKDSDPPAFDPRTLKPGTLFWCESNPLSRNFRILLMRTAYPDLAVRVGYDPDLCGQYNDPTEGDPFGLWGLGSDMFSCPQSSKLGQSLDPFKLPDHLVYAPFEGMFTIHQ